MSRCRVCKDHTFDCEALKTFFLHDYICRYFNEKPTHIRIFCGHAP